MISSGPAMSVLRPETATAEAIEPTVRCRKNEHGKTDPLADCTLNTVLFLLLCGRGTKRLVACHETEYGRSGNYAQKPYGDLYTLHDFESLHMPSDDIGATLINLDLHGQQRTTQNTLVGKYLSKLNEDSDIYVFLFCTPRPPRI